MRRRDFLGLLTASNLFEATTGRAQSPSRVGMLGDEHLIVESFTTELRALLIGQVPRLTSTCGSQVVGPKRIQRWHESFSTEDRTQSSSMGRKPSLPCKRPQVVCQ
jgi:hypothetical protein